MILRMLGPQGIAGIAASLALAILLILSKADARHWKKQSSQFEQLYRGQQAALAATVADYRAAAERARAADQANARRVAAEQGSINQRSAHDFQSRLAAARAAAQRLRVQAAAAAADSRIGRSTPVPSLAAAPAGAAQAAGQDRLPPADALIATEQAIQLDELIKWERAQAKVDNSAPTSASPPDE